MGSGNGDPQSPKLGESRLGGDSPLKRRNRNLTCVNLSHPAIKAGSIRSGGRSIGAHRGGGHGGSRLLLWVSVYVRDNKRGRSSGAYTSVS